MTEDQVEKLIKKYADGIASQQEVRELLDWYRSAPVGKVPWPASEPGEREIVYNRMLQRLQVATAPKAKLRSLAWMRVAAVLLVIIGIGFLLLHFKNGGNGRYITIVNPSGQIKKVTLPDNSVVWMNAATDLKYAKDFRNNRDLELKGEAYFDVAPDPLHPFEITAGGITTTVLGTSFNIKAYEGEKETAISVVHGRVKVSDRSQTLGVLTPSMHLAFNREQKTSIIGKKDTEASFAWKEGRLQFEGASLEAITGSLQRWYNVTVQLNNPAMKNCRYYMAFNNKTPLRKLLSSIAELTGTTYSIDAANKIIVLSGKGCN